MTQQKIDDLFSQTASTKRSRKTRSNTNNRDEFDDLFENSNSVKRQKISTQQKTDVFDFDPPSSSTTTKVNSLKKKRSSNNVNNDNDKLIDDLFNNDTRKKLRRTIKQEETDDVLDMFKTRTNPPPPPRTITTLDDFKPPISAKNVSTQKKFQMFFDDTDLISSNEQNDTKDYIHVKPVLITGGQWLSKEAETKSTCKPAELSDIPEDERNLMHIQYAPLIIDDTNTTPKKSKSQSRKQNSTKKNLDGKSFRKQLVLTDSNIVRKENLQSCYNALLEDINKHRISSSNKSTTTKSSNDDDDEQITNVDFFDLPTRKKNKF